MLNYTILLFVIVSIVLAVAKNNTTKVEIAGLVFDLRFFAMFIVGQVLALKIASAYFGELVLRFIFWGGVIVVCFGALQVLVLPHDFLRHFGYQNSIIPPYFTVDNNQNMIRILSTLRGPNVLGAYLVFWLPILAVITQRIWFRGRRLYLLPLSALWLASVITILGSRSRSGLLGAVVSIGLFILLGVNNIWRKRLIIIGVIGLLVTALALLLSWNTAFIQTSLKHRDPTERGSINSDDQRTNSLIDSVKAIINNPVGSGPGSVNLASTYGDKPVIVENYYLQVAQQYGFLGLILFMMILVMVYLRLWKIRAYDISAALLAGFVGLAVVNMLLPAWGDETVSMLWWGFAGVVIFGYNKKRKHRKNNEPRASK